MKRFSLRLEDELHKQLKLKCVNGNMTMNDCIIQMIKKEMEAYTNDWNISNNKQSK